MRMDLVLGPQRMMLRSTEKESTYFEGIRIEPSTVLKVYVQYWSDYFRRDDSLGLEP